MRASINLALLAVFALASAIPHARQETASDYDDFYDKKPMHTLDLMAGKAQKTAEPSIAQTQVPTPIPGPQTPGGDWIEL